MNSAPAERPMVLTELGGIRNVTCSVASLDSRIHILVSGRSGQRLGQPGREFQNCRRANRALRQRTVLRYLASCCPREQMIHSSQLCEICALCALTRAAQLGELLPVMRWHFAIEHRLDDQQW